MNTNPGRVDRRHVGSGAMLLLSIAVLAVIGHSTRFDEQRAEFRRLFVSTGLLDYGEKGKILKHLGLVYGIRNPDIAPGGRGGTVSDTMTTPFNRKRRAGEYLYLANPASVYRLPSTMAVEKSSFREGWPLLSVVIDEPALEHPATGLVTNAAERGRDWERRVTVSYFDDAKLVFAGGAGIRIHGSMHDRNIRRPDPVRHNYRLYFRSRYGVRMLPPGTVFDDDKGVRRLVVRRERLFASELAFDIARRLGAETPEYAPVIYYLNGERMGIRTLSEQLSTPQWAARLGHDDFYFFKYRGTSDVASERAYRELGRWFRRNREEIDMAMASQRIDVANLTRNLFSFMFCGTNDWYQGAAVFDRSDPNARWYWVVWDMDESFRDNWKTSRGALWEQDALAQVIIGDRKTRLWRVTYSNFRSLMFSRLMNNDPRYREYFLRTVTDALNHRLTPEFFDARFRHYDALIEQYRDSIPGRELKQYESIREFVRHRPEFIRRSLRNRFAETRFPLGEVHRVSFSSAEPDARYLIDGHPVRGPYAGGYFQGQRVRIRRADGGMQNWVVDGEPVAGDVLDLPVRSNLKIRAVPRPG